ncbi:MAG: helicase RepA family protein [Burkholderiales bacterium]
MSPVNTPSEVGDVWDTLCQSLGLVLKVTQAKHHRSVIWDSQDILRPCGDGERTAHLVGLAGSYLASGFTLDQAIEHCLFWNTRNTPPLDDEKIISTCHSIAATDARNHPDRVRGTSFVALSPPQPASPLFSLADARIDSYLLAPPPPRRWVLEGLLPLGIVAAIVAQGGVGKSQLLMQMGFSVSTGVPLAGHWPVGESGTVLMLCAEDSQDEIHRRVHRINKQIGAALPAEGRTALQDNFLVRSMVGIDVLLTQLQRNNEITRTEFLEQLLVTAQQATNLKLIIIDPASRFRGGDENSNPHATRFVQALEYLALTTGATVLLAHHSAKGNNTTSKETTQDSSRGASALTDGLRWQMALTPLTSTAKGFKDLPLNTRHLYMEAKLVKTNYTAPQPAVLLLRGEDGYLQVTTTPTDGTPAFIQDKLDQISLLRLIEGSAVDLTARQIESLHGGVKRELGISEKAVRGLLTIARVDGHVEGASGKPVTITAKGKQWLASQSGGQPKARRAPRGKTTRRVKPQ